MRRYFSEADLVHNDNDLLLSSVLLFLDLVCILIDSLNTLGGGLLRALEIIRDKVGIALEKVFLRKLPFEGLKNQIHCQSFRAAWLTSDNQGDLVQDASNDYEYVLCQWIVHADTLFDVHLLNKLVLLIPDNGFEVVNF